MLFFKRRFGVERWYIHIFIYTYIFSYIYIHIGALMKFHQSYDFFGNIQAFNLLALPESESDDLLIWDPDIARMELPTCPCFMCPIRNRFEWFPKFETNINGTYWDQHFNYLKFHITVMMYDANAPWRLQGPQHKPGLPKWNAGTGATQAWFTANVHFSQAKFWANLPPAVILG